MSLGKRLIQFAELLDVPNFNKMITKGDPDFQERPQLRNFLFWHVTKSVWAAVKRKSAVFLNYLCGHPLFIDLKHSAFQGLLHFFIWRCKDDHGQQSEIINSEIIELLVKYGRSANEIDSPTSSTPLHIAVRVAQPSLVKTLIKIGGDFNSVNDKDETPKSIVIDQLNKIKSLNYIKEELKKDTAGKGTQEQVKKVFSEKPGVSSVNVQSFIKLEKQRYQKLQQVLEILQKHKAQHRWKK